MSSSFSRTWSSARSRCPSEPGSCVPVSTSTIPEPAAIAHALQCGTPGHGSGRRSRHSPGSTRSPRPTSRGRVGLRMAGRYCPGMAASAQGTSPKAIMTAYFEALANQDLDAIAAAWAPDGTCHLVGGTVADGPDGVRAYWAEFFGSMPDLRFQVEDVVADGDQVAVRWSAKGTFAGP